MYNNYAIKASVVAIGEVIKLISEDAISMTAQEVFWVIQQRKLEVYRPPKNELEGLSQAINLVHANAGDMDSMDQLLLACGISDASSKGILTFDEKFMHNRGLTRIRQDPCCKSNYAVTDDPSQ